MQKKNDTELVQEVQKSYKKIKSELGKRIVGQEEVVEDLLASFIAGGHSLLIGVPGLAKTMLISTLSQCLRLEFSRIQFTPDLMPADITGSEVLYEDKSSGKRSFQFIKGPIFSNIVLADEINRTPPKTQAALLQAMQEHEVTAAGNTYALPKPFRVLATQNPIEQEGTYPLPEAQQDRFMFSIEIGYPSKIQEIEIVKRTTMPITDEIEPVLSAEDIMEYSQLVRRVPVSDSVVAYAVALARSTRPHEDDCCIDVKPLLSWGAGPRASQSLIIAAKAYAVLDGRVTPDNSDVAKAAFPVLRHRVVRSFAAEADNISVQEIIKTIIEKV